MAGFHNFVRATLSFFRSFAPDRFLWCVQWGGKKRFAAHRSNLGEKCLQAKNYGLVYANRPISFSANEMRSLNENAENS